MQGDSGTCNATRPRLKILANVFHMGNYQTYGSLALKITVR